MFLPARLRFLQQCLAVEGLPAPEPGLPGAEDLQGLAQLARGSIAACTGFHLLAPGRGQQFNLDADRLGWRLGLVEHGMRTLRTLRTSPSVWK